MLRPYLLGLALLFPSILFARPVGETVRIICHASNGFSDSLIHLNERLTITRRPTYGAAVGFIFDSYQAKLTIDFAEHLEQDRWTMTLIETSKSETVSETSSNLNSPESELVTKFKTPDPSQVIEVSCKIYRL